MQSSALGQSVFINIELRVVMREVRTHLFVARANQRHQAWITVQKVTKIF